MIFDGKKLALEIAEEIARSVETFDRAPSLGVCVIGKNPVSARYVGLKKRIAAKAGIEVEIYRFDESISTEELISEVEQTIRKHDGYIIQLPLPAHVDTARVLNTIPPEKDVDMLSAHSMDSYYKNKTELLPPVVGVFSEILKREKISLPEKKVVVVGYGKLVGKPAAHWFKKQGAQVTVVDLGDDLEGAVRDADIIALGVGSPTLLKANMIKEGVIILDAGTSEDGGALKGDADPAIATHAALFTPVPGGIGPVTVVLLFKNLLSLYNDAR